MSDTTEITVLLCGRSVPSSLSRSVHKRVEERVPELVPGRPYTLKMICGDQYWHGLGNYNTQAGLVMADLVDRQLVPYLFAGDRDDKPLWYWINP
jgi:hypothetical protein